MTEIENDNINLNVDLNNVDTSRQLLAPGKLQLVIKKAETAKTKVGQGTMIKLTLANVQDEKFEDGTGAPANSTTVFHQILATPKGGMTSSMVQRAVAELIQAVGGVPGARLNNLNEWLPALEKRVLLAQVIVEEESTDKNTGKVYPRKNAVKYFVIPRR